MSKLKLYASPEEIKRRTPPSRNTWLCTLTVSLSTILGKYAVYKDSFELEKPEHNYSDEQNIDKFLSYLDKSKKGLKIVSKFGKFKSIPFGPASSESLEALGFVFLFAKDKIDQLGGIELLINDLYSTLESVKKKRVTDFNDINTYADIFSAFSEVTMKGTDREPCCAFDCTDDD